MNLREIVAEWRKGCGNVTQHYREGLATSPNPGDCPACTAAAMQAVARVVDATPIGPTSARMAVETILGTINEGERSEVLRALLRNVESQRLTKDG